jgi:uncharacterized membrane protein YhhN
VIPGLFLFFLVAAADWLAVAKGWKKVEYLAKPGAMGMLLGLLALASGFGSLPRACFGVGIFLSLLGDVFLMVSYARLSNRWFLAGLVCFLLVHVAYIIGLNIPLSGVPVVWGLGIALILALTARRLLGRILEGVRAKGLRRLVAPVAAYGMVITLMLLSALLTLSRLDWKPSASALVALGACLFFSSDVLLAWNRYVTPVRNGRLLNMIAYHLGQAALVVGCILQFR